MRKSWDEYFMEIAEIVKTRSTCLRRQVGAVIVKDNRIITTGYNGAPSGLRHCTDIGGCERERLHIPSGQRHELCRALHAEQNAIIQAAKLGVNIIAVENGDKTNVSPAADYRIQEGDVMVVLGDSYALSRVQKL